MRDVKLRGRGARWEGLGGKSFFFDSAFIFITRGPRSVTILYFQNYKGMYGKTERVLLT